MKAEENKKALADAEYFITCEDQYADIIIDGKIKQGAKLLVSFAEEYCEEKMKPFIEELTYLRQYHKDMEDTINDSKKMGELLAGI